MTTMDTGIHLPPSLVSPETPTEVRPDILQEADQVLKTFRQALPEEYTRCSSLYESAKDLYKDVCHHLVSGKLKVQHGEWTVDELEGKMTELAQKQESCWNTLFSGEQIMRKRVEALYEPVKEMEQKVKNARGEMGAAPWNDHPTAEQSAVRKAYSHCLKTTFHDAKVEFDAITSYPDGLLTQVALLHKHGDTETSESIKQLRKREHSHFKIPNILHKVGAN
jgi:hypothetical protein